MPRIQAQFFWFCAILLKSLVENEKILVKIDWIWEAISSLVSARVEQLFKAHATVASKSIQVAEKDQFYVFIYVRNSFLVLLEELLAHLSLLTESFDHIQCLGDSRVDLVDHGQYIVELLEGLCCLHDA